MTEAASCVVSTLNLDGVEFATVPYGKETRFGRRYGKSTHRCHDCGVQPGGQHHSGCVSHVINQRFIAPVYDVVLNLTAFGCAVAASLLLGHGIPALLSALAILCWLVLARRTLLAHRRGG